MPARRTPHLTEPTPVPALHVTGGMVHAEECLVSVVMWTALPDDRPRLRTQIRFAMTPKTAEALCIDLTASLKSLSR